MSGKLKPSLWCRLETWLSVNAFANMVQAVGFNLYSNLFYQEVIYTELEQQMKGKEVFQYVIVQVHKQNHPFPPFRIRGAKDMGWTNVKKNNNNHPEESLVNHLIAVVCKAFKICLHVWYILRIKFIHLVHLHLSLDLSSSLSVAIRFGLPLPIHSHFEKWRVAHYFTLIMFH